MAGKAKIVAGLLSSITDELAASGLTLKDRLLSVGVLKPESADSPRAIKAATTKYTKSLENPAVAQREMNAASNQFETDFETTDIGERTIIQPEDMTGRILVANRGDPSNIGILRMVGGQDVGEIPVQGGYKFSQQNADQGLGWASGLGVARGAHNRLIRMGDEAGSEPIAVYNRMQSDSTNFSTPPAESLMTQVRNLPISKQDKASFDAELRNSYPQWMGLDDPKAMDQLMGTGDFEGKAIGKMRTAFSTIMGKAAYRDKGFPLYRETIEAVNAPELAGTNYGASGISMYTPRTGEAVRSIGTHKSYDTGMPGDYMGGLEESVPFNVMFPDVYNSLRRETTKPKSNQQPMPFSNEQAIVAANIRGRNVAQPTNQKWLDNIRTYMETGKTLYSRPEAGLLAGGVAGGAMMSPQDAAAQIIEQKYTDPTQRTQLAPRPQMMQSPENPLAAGVSNAMEYANQGMRNIDPTGGLLAPELPADFFRKQAYGEKRGIMDYIFGAAGML
jgi:hypothetical protein